MSKPELTREIVDFYYAACEQQTRNVLEEVSKVVDPEVVAILKQDIATTNPQTVLDNLTTAQKGDERD